MHDIQDLRSTIIPKSDQLNAESLLSGPITITITDVKVTQDEQPVIISFEGDDGRPYKPCKSMRRIIMFAWGTDGRQWVGCSMALFTDLAVKFGNIDVGGIRISHMTHIDKELNVPLTVTKGRKSIHIIKPMAAPKAAPAVDHTAAIQAADTKDALKKVFAKAYRSAASAAAKADYKAAYDARLLKLMNPGHQPPAPPPAQPADATTAAVDPFITDMNAASEPL